MEHPKYRRLWASLTMTALVITQFTTGVFPVPIAPIDAVDAAQDGEWVQTFAHSCNTACAKKGKISIADENGDSCASGENTIKGAVKELGLGIFLAGCWSKSCKNNQEEGVLTESVGPFCYQAGQKRDNDATDITVACYCGNDVQPACSDGKDNDDDGLTDYPADPGCSSASDDNERNSNGPECDDGRDNDGDGKADFPDDKGCDSPTDDDEGDSGKQCSDGIDNDGDGKIDALVEKSASGGNFKNEKATPKYKKTWIATIDCKNGNGSPVTLGNGIPGALAEMVNDRIDDLNLPFKKVKETLLRSENAKGGGNRWTDDGDFHMPTLNAVCNILGYDTYVSSTCLDQERSGRYPFGKCNFHSPHNNTHDYFTGSDIFIPSCSDGIDNDNDGRTDYPADPGCASPEDTNEEEYDPSCSGPNDDSEDEPQCSDGVDNDGDGLKDFPEDPGCKDEDDDNERNPSGPECDDGKDNDGDGKVDYPADPQCDSPTDDDEDSYACSDGIDNDGDQLTDFPDDPGCKSETDDSEKDSSGPECDDGKDNDGDGLIDFPHDKGCDSPTDDDEDDGIPVLDIEKSVSKSKPKLGDTINFRFDIDKSGSSAAKNIVIRDTYPAGLEFIRSTGRNCTESAGTVTCEAFDLSSSDNGDQVWLEFEVKSQSLCHQTLTNSATLDADNITTITSNTVDFTVECDDPPQLTVEKKGPNTIKTGETIKYTFTVKNTGDSKAIDVNIWDVIPTHLTFNDRKSSDDCYLLDASTVQCGEKDLKPGKKLTYTVAFDVSSSAPCGGVIANTGKAWAENVNSVYANTVNTSIECVAQCNDGKDNDGDGKKDYPRDPGCDSPDDDDEYNDNNNPDSCNVIRVWTHQYTDSAINGRFPSTDPFQDIRNGYYAQRPSSLPSNVSWRDLDLFNNTLTHNDVKDADLIIVSDRDIGGIFDARSLKSSEIQLFEDQFDSGTNFIFVADNGPGFGGQEASKATRQILNNITNEIHYSTNWGNYAPGTVTPDGSQYPFLDNVQFHFSGAGSLQSPGRMNQLGNNASCVVGNDSDCKVAWLPNSGNKGFIFASGNAWVGSDKYIKNLIKDYACAPKNECNDGKDNDGDGKIDYPADPGCDSPDDDDEDDEVPDLDITKHVSKSNPKLGDQINYRFDIHRSGKGDAKNIVIRDTYPAGLRFIRSTGPVSCTDQGGTVVCPPFDIPSSKSKKSLWLEFEVESTDLCGRTVPNTGTMEANSTPRVTTNSVDISVECPYVCSDGKDNDGDGKIDFPEDPGCEDPKDDDEEDDPHQCREENVEMKISLSNAQNVNKAIILGNGDIVQSSERFFIIENDSVITDPTLLDDEPYLAVRRGNGFVDVMTHGRFDDAKTAKLNGVVTLIDGIITGFVEGIPGRPAGTGYERATNGDEFTVNSQTKVTFKSLFREPGDGFRLYIEPAPKQCPNPPRLEVEKEGPSTIKPGETIKYTFTVKNTGSSTAKRVNVWDIIPTHLTFNKAQSDSDCDLLDSSTVQCGEQDLSAGKTLSYTVAFDVSSSAPCKGTIANTGKAWAENVNSVYANTVSTTIQCDQTEADISIVKKILGDQTPEYGDTVTFRLVVKNNGPDDAEVMVKDLMPTGFTYLNNNPSCRNAVSNTIPVVMCDPFFLEDGKTKNIDLQFSFDEQLLCTTTRNNGWAGPTKADDPVKTNNDNGILVTLDCPLEIEKDDGKSVVSSNEELDYDITIDNDVGFTLRDRIVIDTLPDNVAYDAGRTSPQPDAVSGPLPNITANAYVSIWDDFAGRNEKWIKKSTTPGEWYILLPNGDLLEWDGQPASANGPVIATVPPVFWNSPYDLVEALNSPERGDILVWLIDVPSQGTTINVGVTTDSGLSDGDKITNHVALAKEEDTDVNKVKNTEPKLDITKTGPSSVIAGENITYEFTIKNTGSAKADNIDLFDFFIDSGTHQKIPPAFTFVSASGTTCSLVNNSFVCPIQELNPNQSTTVSLTFKTPSGQYCNETVMNQADVHIDGIIPGPASDWDKHGVRVSCVLAEDEADLSVTKDAPAQVFRGSTVSYDIAVRNLGPDTAQDVVVIDAIPDVKIQNSTSRTDLVFNAGLSDNRCQQVGDDIKCMLGSLTSGSTENFAIFFDIPSIAECSASIINDIEVGSSTKDTDLDNNDDKAASTVNCATTTLDIKKSGPSTVIRGDTLEYTIVVTNNLGFDTTDNRMIDPIPDHLEYVSSNDPICSFIPQLNHFTCEPFDLDNGDSRTFKVVFRVKNTAVCDGTIANVADVWSNHPGVDPQWSNTVLTNVICPANPDFKATKSVDKTVVQPGERLSYDIRIENTGDVELGGTWVIDPIPAGLTFNSGLSDSRCFKQGNDVKCGDDSIPVNGTDTYTLVFDLSNHAICGVNISNSAQVLFMDNGGISKYTNQVQTYVECPVEEADLQITKDAPSQVFRGSTVSYDIAVKNLGPDTAQDIIVIDAIPDVKIQNSTSRTDLVFNSAQSDNRCQQVGDDIKCMLGSLTSGSIENLHVAFDIPSVAECSAPIINEAEVGSSTNDPILSNNDAEAASTVNCATTTLDIVKSGPATIVRGDTIEYTIVVTNNLGYDTTQNRMIDPIPEHLEYVSSNDPICSFIPQLNHFTCEEFDLATGASRTFTVIFKVKETAQCDEVITNIADIWSDHPGVDPQWSNPVRTTVLCEDPVLTISKTDNRTTAKRGDILEYEIDITNTSDFDAKDVEIIDALPSDVTFLSATLGGSYEATTHTVLWNVDINAKDTVQLVVRGQVDNAAQDGEILYNHVAITGGDSDTDTTKVVVDTPVFTISKTDNRTVVKPGESLTYKITVQNTSTVDAKDVEIVDTLPSNVEFDDANLSGVHNNGVVTWTRDIDAGETIVFEIDVTVDNDAEDEDLIYNFVKITGGPDDDDTTIVDIEDQIFGCIDVQKETFDQNGVKLTPVTQFTFNLNGNDDTVQNDSNGNAKFINVPVGTHTVTEVIPSGWTQENVTPTGGVVVVQEGSSCATVTFKNRQNQIGTPNFTIDKTDNRSNAEPNDTLSYQITVRNTGSVDATNVKVTDSVPNDTSFLSASNGGIRSGNTVEWTFDLAAGQSITLTMDVRVDNNADDGDVIRNTACVSGGPCDDDSTTVEVEDDDDDDDDDDEDDEDVRVTIHDDPDPFDTCHDDDIEYEIRITNSNNSNEEVDVVALLDNELDYRSASNGGRSRGGDRVEWDDIDVNRNSSRTLRLRVRVDNDVRDGDTVRVRVAVSGGDEDTEITRIRNRCDDDDDDDPRPGPPELTIDKTADRTEALAGSVVSYTITIRNTGGEDIRNATLTDDYPEGMMNISDPGGGSDAGGQLRWDLGTLRSNSTTVVRYRVRIKDSVPQGSSIRNTATVRGEGLTRSDSHTIVVPRPPVTGLGGFIKSIGGTTANLTPSVAASTGTAGSDAALPMTIWLTTIFMGLGLGGTFGRRFLF